MSKSSKVFSRTLIATAVSLSALQSVQVYSEDFQIEEITVTAQMREQSLQDVPMSVNAFSEDFMERAGIDDVRGLVVMTPGFNGATEDSFTDAMAMRGISTNDFGVGGDPSVAVFVDGVWAGRTGGVQTSFFDMERAEVLKGPQGTLFGRNAIAGAVSIITKKAVNETEGKIGLGLGENNLYELSGTYNVPLSENLYFRGSVLTTEDDGWLKNLQGGEDYGFHERSSIRTSFRYEGDAVEANVVLQYEDREQNASVYWDPEAGLAKDEVNSELLGRESIDESEIFNVSAQFDVEISETLSLTSITGYKTFNFHYLEDYDASPLRVDNYMQDNAVDYFSQDIRLNFSSENLVWFLGVSAYKEEIDAEFGAFADENDYCAAISLTDADDFEGPAANCADDNWQVYFQGYDDVSEVTQEDRDDATASALANKNEASFNQVESDGWAVFADFTYSVSESLDLMYGVRYTEDSKRMDTSIPYAGGYLGNDFNTGFYTDGYISSSDTWSELTHRLAFNLQLNDEISIYGNYGQGYKAGGFATFGIDFPEGVDGAEWLDENYGDVIPDGAKPTQFDPEYVDSYELGVKTKMLENTLQINASLYYYEYSDLQFVYFDNGSSLVDNLGEASGTGAEFDIRYLPNENWDLFFTLSLQDTEITDDSDVAGVACAESGCAGNALPFAPEVNTAFLATYRLPMSNGETFFTMEHFYQDKQFSDLDGIENIAQEAYDVMNLRAGYESADDWSVTLWVENVFSEEYFERGWANADVDGTYGYGLVNAQTWPSKPRTVGVNFDMSF